MKYVVDIDALCDCFDCVEGIKYNGNIYIALDVAKEFISRFPKTPVETEYYELKLAKEEQQNDCEGMQEEV